MLTNRCLRAVRWGYGEEPKGTIGLWISEEEREDKEERLEKLGKYSLVEMNKGDDPYLLALVIESGELYFKVV